MTKKNAFRANNPVMSEKPRTHRHYEFGTFDERLEHFCAVMEVDVPEWPREDGEPTLNDDLVKWARDHGVDWDWLFAGSPSAMVCSSSRARKTELKITEYTEAMEPEIRKGLVAMLDALIKHGVPHELAFAEFTMIVKKNRAEKAA
ncbi:hypothetical protein AAFO92_13800 [Roseovarius sp. CAU 1744]|uniref:hypothetical protein n=1 Tax=Roseovarius sp. CAU 1744 TaxID=3140368 RepID=UPI00325AC878